MQQTRAQSSAVNTYRQIAAPCMKNHMSVAWGGVACLDEGQHHIQAADKLAQHRHQASEIIDQSEDINYVGNSASDFVQALLSANGSTLSAAGTPLTTL